MPGIAIRRDNIDRGPGRLIGKEESFAPMDLPPRHQRRMVNAVREGRALFRFMDFRMYPIADGRACFDLCWGHPLTQGGDRRSPYPCDWQVAVLVSESLTRASFLVQVR